LAKKDRQQIAEMLKKGQASARVLRRALILRQLDHGQAAAQVADNVGVAPKTVRAIARRYEEEGLESALYERPRKGKSRLLDIAQSQRIIAMVCSPAPEGQARWSVRLIATEAVKRKLVARVGRETIRILLRDHELKPVVLHADVRPGRPMRPGQIDRHDCEGHKTIHLVMDNLSTHTRKALVNRFGEKAGAWLWQRFTLHYTPKHGSWLNQAEIEISLFSRQCLGQRRIPSLGDLRREARAWNRKMNRDRTTIDWRFTRTKARAKFGYTRNNITQSRY
jgi:transposase